MRAPDDSSDAPRSAPAAGESKGEAGTALLVEDDPAVRALAARLLGRIGYRVLVAGEAQEALDIEARERGAIDVLITDVVLPGLSGPQLARRLGKRREGLPTLFVSGYAGNLPGLAEALATGAAFLAKPFSQAELARSVARLRARGGERADADPELGTAPDSGRPGSSPDADSKQ